MDWYKKISLGQIYFGCQHLFLISNSLHASCVPRVEHWIPEIKSNETQSDLECNHKFWDHSFEDLVQNGFTCISFPVDPLINVFDDGSFGVGFCKLNDLSFPFFGTKWIGLTSATFLRPFLMIWCFCILSSSLLNTRSISGYKIHCGSELPFWNLLVHRCSKLFPMTLAASPTTDSPCMTAGKSLRNDSDAWWWTVEWSDMVPITWWCMWSNPCMSGTVWHGFGRQSFHSGTWTCPGGVNRLTRHNEHFIFFWWVDRLKFSIGTYKLILKSCVWVGIITDSTLWNVWEWLFRSNGEFQLVILIKKLVAKNMATQWAARSNYPTVCSIQHLFESWPAGTHCRLVAACDTIGSPSDQRHEKNASLVCCVLSIIDSRHLGLSFMLVLSIGMVAFRKVTGKLPNKNVIHSKVWFNKMVRHLTMCHNTELMTGLSDDWTTWYPFIRVHWHHQRT